MKIMPSQEDAPCCEQGKTPQKTEILLTTSPPQM
jgi:hypothetical protein